MDRRKLFEKERKKLPHRGELITEEDQLRYFRRLITPYKKKGRSHYFITQYLLADGNELRKKFWSIRSSSRFAFELYSWMSEDSRVGAFLFEKKLTGIKNSPIPPNMDVYLEIANRSIFIESKFAEEYTQKAFKIPDAYWKDKEAKSSDGKPLKSSLKDRYHGKGEIAAAFVDLIDYTDKLLKESAKDDDRNWMEFAQEIKHLIGIALTVSTSNGYYKNKNIEFYNVFYDFEDATFPYINDFFQKAKDIMEELLVKTQLCKSFRYEFKTAQELVRDGTIIPFEPETKAFASDRPIHDILWNEFHFDPWGRHHNLK